MAANVDDVDRIMAVMSCAFDPEFGEAWTRRQVEDALVIGNCHYFLADDCGLPAGDDATSADIAGFALTRSSFEEEELLLFAVRPTLRGRGIGNALLGLFIAAAQKRGIQRLLLEMRRGNPAENLYRKHGFVPVGVRRDYYRTLSGTRLDAITFACDLVN